METILIICASSCLLFFMAHILAVRISSFFKFAISQQLLLFMLMILWNIPLVIGTIITINNMPQIQVIPSLLYVVLVYNCIAYSYFHVFNMSDTARRIRLLIAVQLKEIVRDKDIAEIYAITDMVNQRIERLVNMRQITKNKDGRYVINNSFLLRVSFCIDLWKKMLRLQPR